MKIEKSIHPVTGKTILSIEPDNEQKAEEIMSLLSTFEGFFIGTMANKTYRIPFMDVFYFEFSEESTFIHTAKHTFSSDYRLYEIPLISDYFMRVHKSFVVNMAKIDSFKNSPHGRVELFLVNGDRLIVSRTYVPTMKLQLGGQVR